MTGHGIRPALLMAETCVLRILAADLDDVGEILTRASRVLTETGSGRLSHYSSCGSAPRLAPCAVLARGIHQRYGWIAAGI